MDLPLIKIINSGILSTIQAACRTDFQDYGDEEAKIADSIGDKIYNLFN